MQYEVLHKHIVALCFALLHAQKEVKDEVPLMKAFEQPFVKEFTLARSSLGFPWTTVNTLELLSMLRNDVSSSTPCLRGF
jgi:hypothetical protein